MESIALNQRSKQLLWNPMIHNCCLICCGCETAYVYHTDISNLYANAQSESGKEIKVKTSIQNSQLYLECFFNVILNLRYFEKIAKL